MEATSQAWNKQHLNVTGFFKFFGIVEGAGLEAEMLKQAVEEAHRRTPWVSTAAEGTNWVKIGERPTKETLIVTMYNRYTVLPRQLYAFQKHLAGMAQLLVARKMHNIGLVHFWMNVETVWTPVWSPTENEAYEKIQARLMREFEFGVPQQ